MNPKKFFSNDKPLNNKLKILKKDLFFKYDESPGYSKDGYSFEVKSYFTGWPDDDVVQLNNKKKEKGVEEKKIVNSSQEEITLKTKLIKKISYMPNCRLEDTKQFFEKQNKVNNWEESDEDEKSTLYNQNLEENKNDLNNELNNNCTLTNNTSQPIERINNGIKMGEEELKLYKLKIEKAKNSEQNIFKLIKEIKNSNQINNNDYSKEKIKFKSIQDIENNEIKLLTPNKQNELLMLFEPEIINSTKDTICESCKMKGHSKKECIQFPCPEYEQPLKYCMNCGDYGHLYCRSGMKDIENNNIFDESFEDDENCIYNHGKKYKFEFLDEDKVKENSNQEEEEELFETGATNIINEDIKDNNMLNYLF